MNTGFFGDRQQVADDAMKLARLAGEYKYAVLWAELEAADRETRAELDELAMDLRNAAQLDALERSQEAMLADNGGLYFNDAKHAA